MMTPEKKKITIQLGDPPNAKARIVATVIGQWAFHEAFQGPGWQVTFVPRGACLNLLADHFAYREAMQIAAQLGLENIAEDDAFVIQAIVAEAIT